VARVLPDVAGFERELDYSVPDELAADLRPGGVVRVPLRGRTVRGWVLGFPVEPLEGLVLRPVAKLIGWGPEPALLDLAAWAAWRWAGRRRSFLVTASPLVVVKAVPAAAVEARPPVAAKVRRPGGHHAFPGAGGARPPDDRGAAEARQLVGESWGPGTHVLRLPPVYSATEVVLAAAEHGPVLVVAPTNARATAGCAALRRRGARVALLPGDWGSARAGADIVIGARSAAWGPCPDLAGIIVLDAHDEGLVQEQAPTWDAPSVAGERARRAAVPCLWVSPCPTLELLSAGELHAASRATERSGWARLQVVDRRRSDPRAGLYSPELTELVRHAEGRVVCVLNRKGRALLLDCAACGEVARCEHCAGAVHLVGAELTCRRCGRSRPLVCAACGSDSLRSLRVGVTRAREQLEALAGRPVGEVTGPGAGGGPREAASARSADRESDVPDSPVLVGTEGVLYRESELRRGGGVGAVAFLDFDQELLAPRYRAAEEALALLARASRLVGGRHRGGRVLVQTRVPGHPAVEAAALADPGRLAAAEGPVRRALRLPPYTALAVLSGPGSADLAGALERRSGGGNGGFGGSGGRGGPVEVMALGDGRWAVRAPDHAGLADALAAVERPEERVRVEVGPVRF
jgi:primosomal protein N' (replication factor Y)